MKLQLWTDTGGDNPQADDLLGEIDVDDDAWTDAQSSPADALMLIQDLALEVGE